MQKMMLLVLSALCCHAILAKNIQRLRRETADEEKMKEAIQLTKFSALTVMSLMVPAISLSELEVGKQLMDRVSVGNPQFKTGLIYDSTVGKTMKMMDKFRNKQLIDDDFYASIRDSFEGMRGTERHFADVRGQYVITGRINMVDTTAVEGDPKSISWSYALCKVAVNSLRKEEQRSLMVYMTYLQQKKWLETSLPYSRQLLRKCIAYEKFLPVNFQGTC